MSTPQATTGDKILDEIQQAVIAILNRHNGYCGAAIGENMCMLNSSNERRGVDYIIKMEATHTQVAEESASEPG